MALWQDFLLNAFNGDILIQNGDLVVGASDDQNIYDIIFSDLGQFQQYPNIGCGITNYINGSNLYKLQLLIKAQLKSDNFNVNSINISYDAETNVFDINPNATRNN